MKIILYKSALCPRCHAAGKHLRALKKEYSQMTIEEIDILIHPLQAWQAGIKMIPAITYNNRTLSGVILGRSAIKSFLQETIEIK